ncbi:FG-GAP-like repeat-containing protein [Crossiella sp. CA-258035]|uniref:FG-GAP-like repeat-containing protein n=1 Tax=Crossiella sp. CA-258035 TaxID=2981138 RepID=UPI0024BC6B39|nr:FG-GAP-like repeat-containing protein [Crossiella sp. CA-258035]WHT21673.1 FG-GAP-like repeat-containing protein [Crossiella sp. CA-258035]
MTRHRAGKAVGLLAFTTAAALLTSLPAHGLAGGTAAAEGSYGFVAKIDVGPGTRSCSGVLIDPNWVLTVKSCFPENAQGGKPAQPTKVTVGRAVLSGSTGQVVDAVNLVHRADRNLSLVRLATPVAGVVPATVAKTAPAAGDTVRLAGYGRTATEWTPDRLHTGPAKVESAAATTLSVLGEGSVSVCRGDSGGPAFRETGSRAEVIGLHAASWQGGCMGETETRRTVTESRVDNLDGWLEAQLIGLTATPLAQHGNQLSWLNPPSLNATAYRVYGAQTADVPLVPANLLGTVSDGRYAHTALPAKQTWHYRVVPVTAAGDGPVSSVASATVKTHTISDFNGDGRDDISAIYDYSNGDAGTFSFDGTVAGPTEPVSKHRTGPNNWTVSSAKYLNGDFNGDGFADWGAFYNYGGGNIKFWVRWGSPTGLKDGAALWDSAGQWDWNRAQFVAGDFNGDGRTDVTAAYGYENGRTAFWLFRGNPTGVDAPVQTWNSGDGNWERTSSTFVAGDFNGDGRDDMAALYNYGGYDVALFIANGTVDGHTAPVQQWRTGPNQWDPGRSRLLAGDFDGDGRTDIAGLYGYPDDRLALYVAKSTANGLGRFAMTWETRPGDWHLPSSVWVAGDFNGDGRSDLGGFYHYGGGNIKLFNFRGQPGGGTDRGADGWDSRGGWYWERAHFIQ